MCEIFGEFAWGFKDEIEIFVILDVSRIDDLFEAFKVLKVHNLEANRIFFFEGLDLYVHVVYFLPEVGYLLLQLVIHHLFRNKYK